MHKGVEEGKTSHPPPRFAGNAGAGMQSKNGMQAQKASRNANYERSDYLQMLTTRPKTLWVCRPAIYSR